MKKKTKNKLKKVQNTGVYSDIRNVMYGEPKMIDIDWRVKPSESKLRSDLADLVSTRESLSRVNTNPSLISKLDQIIEIKIDQLLKYEIELSIKILEDERSKSDKSQNVDGMPLLDWSETEMPKPNIVPAHDDLTAEDWEAIIESQDDTE